MADDRSKYIEKTQWRPGESGNPAGKPKGAISKKTILRQILDLEVPPEAVLLDKLRARYPELFQDPNKTYNLEFIVTLRHVLRAITAEKPDRAIIDILDRIHGRPLQSFNLMSNADLDDDTLTSDQVREQIAELRRRRESFENARTHVSETDNDGPGDPE